MFFRQYEMFCNFFPVFDCKVVFLVFVYYQSLFKMRQIVISLLYMYDTL